MPAKYGPEVIQACHDLYLQFNGQSFDRIEKEMRKKWGAWSRQNLITRGDKIGWIERYNWEDALRLKIESAGTRALTESDQLFREVNDTRKRLKKKLDAEGFEDKNLLYAYRDFCKLSIEALNKIEAARDSLEGFVVMWERLLDWLPTISEKAARELLKVADEVIERATAEYGEKEADARSQD